MAYQDAIYNKLMDYLTLKKYPFKKSGALTMVKCPKCGKEPFTGQKIPNVPKINCFTCKKFTILDFVKKIEPEFKDSNDEKIIKHIRDLFNIPVVTDNEQSDLEKLFQKYKDNGFCLTPLCKNSNSIPEGHFGKMPVKGNNNWQKTSYTNIKEWLNWIKLGLNVGMVCGLSKKTTIDIDTMPKIIKEKIYSGKASEEEKKQAIADSNKLLDEILGKLGHPEKLTMHQITNGGMHIIFNYVEGFRKTKINELHIDVEHDGGYIAIQPSKIGDTTRQVIGDKTADIPEELKKFLLEKMESPVKTNTSDNPNLGNYEGMNFGLVDKGQGRSEYLIKFGGILRNNFPIHMTEKMIKLVNQTHCNPPIPDIGLEKTVLKSIRNYTKQDERNIKNEVLNYLEKATRGRSDEIEICVFSERVKGEKKLLLASILVELIQEDKIQRKKNEYFLIKKANWKTSLIDRAKPLDFKIPYFDDITRLKYGEQILIGAQSGSGKTTLVMNIIERLVKQGKTPKLFETEVKNFIEIALARGLKECDFLYDDESDPLEVEFEKNSIIIIDWLDPSEDFTQVPSMFKRLKNQLIKSNSFLITFMQLKEDGINKNGWFSPNSCKHYPSLAVKFLLEDVNTNRKNGKFLVTKNNKPKHPETRLIPTYYDENTCQVRTIKEIEAEKRR